MLLVECVVGEKVMHEIQCESLTDHLADCLRNQALEDVTLENDRFLRFAVRPSERKACLVVGANLAAGIEQNLIDLVVSDHRVGDRIVEPAKSDCYCQFVVVIAIVISIVLTQPNLSSTTEC